MAQIKPRGYQLYIISRILRAKAEGTNIIIELDAGMGKRVISYLMTKYMEPGERLLFITPSRASLRDTYAFFKEHAHDLRLDINYLSTNKPKTLKRKILSESDVVLTTPITLYNVAKDLVGIKFDYILINEVDKVVRRVVNIPIYDKVEEYLASLNLVYPWMHLKRLLNKDACWVGLSGTLRDLHTVKIREEIVFKRELETIAELLFPRERKIDIITMDEILKVTDAYQYILENITIVKRIPVRDEVTKKIVDAITDEIYSTAKKLISKYSGNKIDLEAYEKIEKAIGKLPNQDPYKHKFLRLSLVRKFILASPPDYYKRYLKRPSIMRIIKRNYEDFDLNKIPSLTKKIEKIKDMTKKWVEHGKKIAIMCSYIRTANVIKQKLEEEGIKVFMLTGKTPNKGKILEMYKNSKRTVLILTPVGERDLDLVDTDLLIIHDVINTVKSMYQRFKRGRRSFVAIIFYKETYEENKVKKLLQRIKTRYPWSIVIE